MKLDDLVVQYIALRDRRATRKQAFTNEDAADAALQKKIEAVLLKQFSALGMDSIKTEHGTAYRSLLTSVTVADREAFLEFCIGTGATELLDVRANKTSVVQYKEATGQLPPAVNWREEATVNVRRS